MRDECSQKGARWDFGRKRIMREDRGAEVHKWDMGNCRREQGMEWVRSAPYDPDEMNAGLECWSL